MRCNRPHLWDTFSRMYSCPASRFLQPFPAMSSSVVVWLATLPESFKLNSGRCLFHLPCESGRDPVLKEALSRHGLEERHESLHESPEGAIEGVAQLRVMPAYHHLLQLDSGGRWQYEYWRAVLGVDLVGCLFGFEVLNVQALPKPQPRQQLSGHRCHAFVSELEDGEQRRLRDALGEHPDWLDGRYPETLLRLVLAAAMLIAGGVWPVAWIPDMGAMQGVIRYFRISWRSLGVAPPSTEVAGCPAPSGDRAFTPQMSQAVAEHLRNYAALLQTQGNAGPATMQDLTNAIASLQEYRDETCASGLVRHLKAR